MTDLRKAAQMALEALERYEDERLEDGRRIYVDAELDALRQALAQPEQEPKLSDAGADTNIPLWGLEPKGKGMLTFHQPEPKSISTNDHLCAMLRQVHDVLACTALPMKRPWVGLTNEDMHIIRDDAFVKNVDDIDWALQMVRRVEAKLRSKNNAV